MGGHNSQKWYDLTTGDQEIDRYGSGYRLSISITVIEIIERCLKKSIAMVENIDC